MNKRCFILLFIFALLYTENTHAQTTLAEQLGSSTDFGFIKLTVTNYYKQQMLLATNATDLKKITHDQKMWARWLWYNEGRLDENNQITNVSGRNLESILATTNNPTTPDIFYGGWANIGPYDVVNINNTSSNTGIGRVTCFAFHPTDVNTFYVGTLAGGVWKTVNGGLTYAPYSDELASLGIASIVVNQINPNEVYVMTGDGDSHNAGGWFIPSFGYIRWSAGVFKSTNGGITWNKTGLSFTTSQKISGYKIIQDPTNTNVLIAATSDGIYRSDDAGNIFTKVNNAHVSDLRFKEGNSNIVFAAPKVAGARLLRSVNNGQVFSTVANTLPFNISRMAFASTPADPSKLYMLCGASIDSAHSVGLYRTLDDGDNVTLVNNTPNVLSSASDGITGAGFYDEVPAHLTLATNPASSTRFISGCVNIWRSANTGASFTFSGSTHADIHQIVYNPLNSVAYAATDGGVYSSTDNGATWNFLSSTLNCATFYHLTGTEQDGNRLLGGLQDDGTSLRTTGNTYYFVGGGDGFAAAINKDRSATHYIGGNTGVFRSNNGGLSNSTITPPAFTGANAQWYPDIMMHPTDTSIIYVGFSDVCRSDNRGTNWNYVGANGNWSLAVSPNTPDRIYAAGGDAAYGTLNGGLYRNDNKGISAWDVLSTKPGFPTAFGKITDIAVNPTNGSDVWVTFGGFFATTKVAHSTDAGLNWSEVHGSLSNVPVNCVVVDNSGNVYIGTDIGVYFRSTTDNDWKPFYNGLPRIPVTDLIINNPNSKIRAATFGRGVFESALYTACPATLTLNALYSGQQTFSASSSITSTATINSTAGTEVFLKAGNNIDMLAGFTAQAGTFYKAKIGSCIAGIDSTNLPNLQNADKVITESALLISKQVTTKSLQTDSIMQVQKNNIQKAVLINNNKLAAEIEADKKKQEEKEAAKQKGELKKE